MAQNRSGKIGNESSPSISPPSVDAVNVKDNSNKASKFLKTSSNRTLQSAVKPTYAAVSNPGRMSAALQKAQILSNKYKAPQRTKLISDGNVPHQEQVPIALQIGVNDGKESTISNTAIDADSLRSILDVRNLIDLSSSSQSYNNEISNDKEDIKISANDDEYSDGTDSFKLQVKTIKDLSESLPSSVLSDRGHKVLNNNREVSLHSQIDENYSDDFEKSTSSLSQEVSEMDNSSPLDSRYNNNSICF